ncbi:MAG TPA: hypothetical protein VFK14_00185 [Solirubrobacterales bacterium]|nr:hypothetical protein [Solirubrobacterales bacterium]
MSKPKPRSKAKAAVEETDSKSKTIDWRGHTFKLPADLPKSLVFRMTEIEEAGEDTRPTLKLLASLLNAEEPTQYGTVIREIEGAEDEDKVVVEAFELVGEIFEQYGTSEGESAASQDS